MTQFILKDNDFVEKGIDLIVLSYIFPCSCFHCLTYIVVFLPPWSRTDVFKDHNFITS